MKKAKFALGDKAIIKIIDKYGENKNIRNFNL